MYKFTKFHPYFTFITYVKVFCILASRILAVIVNETSSKALNNWRIIITFLQILFIHYILSRIIWKMLHRIARNVIFFFFFFFFFCVCVCVCFVLFCIFAPKMTLISPFKFLRLIFPSYQLYFFFYPPFQNLFFFFIPPVAHPPPPEYLWTKTY